MGKTRRRQQAERGRLNSLVGLLPSRPASRDRPPADRRHPERRCHDCGPSGAWSHVAAGPDLAAHAKLTEILLRVKRLPLLAQMFLRVTGSRVTL